jgi:SanA protein
MQIDMKEFTKYFRGRRLLRRIVVSFAVFSFLSIGLNWYIYNAYAGKVYQQPSSISQLSKPRIAIVFGAGLRPNGEPSTVLYDRVATAVELYKAGHVQKLLMSGDNRFKNYDEPSVMRETALKLGIPDKDIVLDFAGRRTYDSCYRAKEVFEVQRAILVTQEFHLPRALHLCSSMGIDSVGVAANRRNYGQGKELMWQIREFGAVIGAWIDTKIWKPTPVRGPKQPVEELAY